jgi:hypothetical protein
MLLSHLLLACLPATLATNGAAHTHLQPELTVRVACSQRLSLAMRLLLAKLRAGVKLQLLLHIVTPQPCLLIAVQLIKVLAILLQGKGVFKTEEEGQQQSSVNEVAATLHVTACKAACALL